MLSIVAIGRNESANLPRLADSIDALRSQVDLPIESIFIDSASTDNSREIALERFDSVVELEDSPHLCASAGRFAGTLEARYPWVFYIDGDMEINPAFFPVIERLDELDDDVTGVIGIYIHRFDNGNVAAQSFAKSEREAHIASRFGGAVILRRAAVIAAGNWDPSIYGKEEMELYVRLGNGKFVVRNVSEPMVNHYSEYYSRLELLLRLLFPSAGLGKVFWGYGQSVRALTAKGKFLALVRLEYEVYMLWASLILVIMVGLFVSVWAAVLLLIGIFVAFSLWLRPGSVIRYLTLPLSFVPGWFRYFPWFRPRLMRWGSTEKTAK